MEINTENLEKIGFSCCVESGICTYNSKYYQIVHSLESNYSRLITSDDPGSDLNLQHLKTTDQLKQLIELLEGETKH